MSSASLREASRFFAADDEVLFAVEDFFDDEVLLPDVPEDERLFVEEEDFFAVVFEVFFFVEGSLAAKPRNTSVYS